MGRHLLAVAVALAQYPPITGTDPVSQLYTQAAEIRSGSPDLELIVFPEIHLCGDADTAEDANACSSLPQSRSTSPGCAR